MEEAIDLLKYMTFMNFPDLPEDHFIPRPSPGSIM
jgi:hypothetical protein